MKIYFTIFILLICILLHAQTTQKYNLSTDSRVNLHASNKRVYFATRITERPRIVGKLNDPCWSSSGVWSGDFIQQQPLQGRPPSQKTKIKILYDENNLYVAMRCFDNSKEGIQSILSRRDEIDGDIAGITFDSYADKRTAFEFDVSAAGQKVDLIHLGSYQYDTNWDTVWDAKTQLMDSLWTVEMKIPFTQLRFTKKMNKSGAYIFGVGTTNRMKKANEN